jgi:CheY-like chemotaxis protein/phosphoribosyl 1,2-cyclic phosphodiesterase
MRVRFWGTRGSIAVPGPDTVRFGGNTSCVEVTTNGGDCFMFDCGTGARALGAKLVACAHKPISATILLSHTHWDHIQGFPFFAPLFIPGTRITVCGPEGSGRSLREVLAGQMEFTYFPVDIGQLPASITFQELGEGTYEIGGARIVAQYLHHPTMTLGYRVEVDGAALVYACDHEPFSETLWRDDPARSHAESIVHEGDRRHARFMAGADMVIHDAQYTPEESPSKKNWGHSTYEYSVGLAAAAGVRELVLTHHDPTHDDAFVDEIETRARRYAAGLGDAVRVCCAHEGLELTLAPHGVSHLADTPVAPHSGRDARRGSRILVVDDDPDIRALANRALIQDGHIVIEASGGREALALIDSQLFDLLLLDLLMPEPGGLEVLKILRSRSATAALPIVVLTALDDEVNTRSSFELGATDYLTKPFSIPQLAARVRACLARTGLEFAVDRGPIVAPGEAD